MTITQPVQESLEKRRSLDDNAGTVLPVVEARVISGASEENSSSRFLYEPEELERIFQQLAGQWRAETKYFSDLMEKVTHPAYQRIIGLGPQVLPLILREMEQRPAHWFWALKYLTPENENPAESCQNFRQMVDAWLQWGKEHGYI